MATRLLVGPVCASSGNASRAAWARVFHVERRASSMVCHRTAPSEIQDAPRTLSTSGEVPKFSTGSHSALAGTCVVAWTRDMRKITIIGIVLILLAPAPAGAQQVSSDDNRWTWPLRGRALTTTITAGFDPPSSRFGAGHRGIDLAGTSGDDVLAVASGVVSYVGVIDGVPNVVVDHGRQRSTYQPVSADVRQGERVRAGAVLGTLVTSGSHCASACLHLGRIRQDTYLDPAELLSDTGRFVLISPEGPPPSPPNPPVSGGDLRWPVDGQVTSPFGMRVHPITGVKKLHDGTDIAAACGTSVTAAAGGNVIERSTHGAYGNRVLLRHRGGVVTAYNHLRGQSVAAGQRVRAGQKVGTVGQTGLATGCHLHFMVITDGRPVDPATWLASR